MLGREVSSCDELQENDKLWLVRPGKEFMWPTFEVGHLVEVRHVSTANRQPIIIETLSKSPKVSPSCCMAQALPCLYT